MDFSNLEPCTVFAPNGDREHCKFEDSLQNANNMSVCLDNNNVLTSELSTSGAAPQLTESQPLSAEATNHPAPQPVTPMPAEQSASEPKATQLGPPKTITKLLVANQAVVGANAPVLQKLTNPPVITVLNSAGGPLTVLKTICVTSSVPSSPHFSLVNNQALPVTNSLLGKSPTITLINAPLSVVKVGPQPVQAPVISLQPEKTSDGIINVTPTSNNASTIIENRAHNVFVKNTCTTDFTGAEVSQGHKILTASNFPQTTVLTGPLPNTKPAVPNNMVTAQKGKLKVLGNVIVPNQITTSSLTTQQATITSNVILNKAQPPQQPPKVIPRHKVVPATNVTKFVGKPVPTNNLQNVKPPIVSNVGLPIKYPPDKAALQTQSRLMYPTHKSQIKTIPPVNNYAQKATGIKTLSPQPKAAVPGQVQRTGSGLRTIPPQRPQRVPPSKPNYIGKHAAQAQKAKPSASHNSYMPPMNDKQLTFNQALTAEILETLGSKSGSSYAAGKGSYEVLSNRMYDGSYSYEQKALPESTKYEDKSKSGLDALSLICQAVLLDHNYNATLPPDSPTRMAPISNASSQINGASSNSVPMFSPSLNKRRPMPVSNPVSTSSSSMSLIPSNSNSMVNLPDDDAGSDISDCSDRKHDTEGEETDTAPEAEAVTNDETFDHYGDYVTRCICGFLHDDGYMVECDRCKVWQHVQCVVKNKQVPDEFLCEMCDPSKPVDSYKARLIQQQWLREKLPDLKMRKDNKLKEPILKHKEPLSDTDSSDAENPRHNNNSVNSKTRVAGRKKCDKNVKPKKELGKDLQQRKTVKRREKKLVRRKTRAPQKPLPSQLQQHDDDNQPDTFSTMHLPQLRQWIENYEEAVTNHYSPELRARISSIRVNGQHTDQPAQPIVAYDPNVCKCRVHTQPLTEIRYLVTTHIMEPESPVIELRGKYMLSTQHRNNASGGTLTTRQHAQRPGPFLFFYRLAKDNTEVCVDTRTYGNAARFIRRSCRPNAELRHCIEKGVLHLYIVTIAAVPLGQELTIRHESHDLAAAGTTHIACYCGLPSDECKINNRNNANATTSVKKNGESSANNNDHGYRKRRGRRTTSISTSVEAEPLKVKPEAPPPSPPEAPPPVKMEVDEDIIKEEPVEIKEEPKEEIKIEKVEEVKVEIKEERPITPKKELEESSSEAETKTPEKKEKRAHLTPISTRRSSHYKSDKSEEREPLTKQEKSKNKKLSREERKLEAILRAIEQMEKADQKKQEHKHTGKQVHRRESEPAPADTKEEDKANPEQRQKRKRRKGRARTVSTHSTRRDRLNSADSYLTSSDEVLLSPNDGIRPGKPNKSISTDDSRGPNESSLLMTVSSQDKCDKSPVQDVDMNSNPSNSPETPLSFACSLVQAAVEPLEAGFKFPKTKKGLMNEWLNKTPDSTMSTLSPLSSHIGTTEYDPMMGFYGASKNLTNLMNEQQHSQPEPKGSAKKRWLRQAISEDKNDNIHSCSDSPPRSDSVAPPKKRRLPRESISNDNSPPSTPTGLGPSLNQDIPQEGCVEIVYNGPEGDSPSETLESDAILKERAAEMKQEFSKCLIPPETESADISRPNLLSFRCLMDPRLARNRHRLLNSDQLVGTVEKTLSILGFNDRKPDPITPIKRKLSITEYRQRKKVPANENSDTCDKGDDGMDECLNEENNSSESFKPCRTRLNSNSTSTSLSSDDEAMSVELVSKAPAFNSEPTELERQREISNLRLKKAFGLSIDVEPRKPALDVEAILNCEIPMPDVQVQLSAPSAASEKPDEDVKDTSLQTENVTEPMEEEECNTPVIDELPAPEVQQLMSVSHPEEETSESVVVKKVTKEKITKKSGKGGKEPHQFYTPDEEEDEEERTEENIPELESVNYVPPFNNPIYPSNNFTSVIDEEGRYEGRNPSPPPDLDSVDQEV